MDSKDSIIIKTKMDDKYLKTRLEDEKLQEIKTRDDEMLVEFIRQKGIFTSAKDITYTYKAVISTEGGEGSVVLCDSAKYGEVAVKVYFDVRNVSLERREKIIAFTNMEGADNYVLPILDNGFIEFDDATSNYFEVQTFCKEGNLLSMGKCSYEDILEIVSELNEGLYFIHKNGFLHMDIKPENIYYYNNRYVLGDFGVTRELDSVGQSITVITHIGKSLSGTPGYMAPEVLFGTSYYELTAKTDYYSLAVTIASLYVGRFVFATNGIYDARLCQQSADSSHIELQNTNDRRTLLLQNLVDGLYQRDDRYRFGYEDVCKWLANPQYKGSIDSKTDMMWSVPFQGSNKEELIYTEKELFTWMASNWEEAKERLYRGHFEEHFKRNNEAYVSQELSKIVEDKYPDINKEGNLALFEACYLIYDESDAALVWKGKSWNSLQLLSEEIFTAESTVDYNELFINKLISNWLKVTNLLENEDELGKLIRDIENAAEINTDIACFWFAYMFAEEKNFSFNNQKYKNVSELIGRLVESPYELYLGIENVKDLLDFERKYKLYGFLCSGGESKKGCNRFVFDFIQAMPCEKCEQLHLFFFMLERIAGALNNMQLLEKIQKTYLAYGPYGYIKYTYTLVKEKEYYYADEETGKKIIDEIKKMPEVKIQSVSLMGRELQVIKKKVDRMVENMQNNPILAEAGIFEGKKIKCTNLQGYFLYNFLDKEAPLGYKEIIERR